LGDTIDDEGLREYALGLRVEGLGFRVQGLAFRFKKLGLGLRVQV